MSNVIRSDTDTRITIEFSERGLSEKYIHIIIQTILFFSLAIFFVISMVLLFLGKGAEPLIISIIGLIVHRLIFSKYPPRRTGSVTFRNTGKVTLWTTLEQSCEFNIKDISAFELGETQKVEPKSYKRAQNDTTISVYMKSGERITIGRNIDEPDDNLKIITALKNAHAEAMQVVDGHR